MASPISTPKAASSVIVSCRDLRTANLMPIRQASAATNQAMPKDRARSVVAVGRTSRDHRLDVTIGGNLRLAAITAA
jgi:hypothetical protein